MTLGLVLIAAALVAGVLLAWPWLIEGRRRKIGAVERAQSDAAFAALDGGVTCYRWVGPADGPVIVAIHGMTTPSVAWAHVAQGLAEDGFRVLTYDLWGRGLSDANEKARDCEAYAAQLRALLAHQNISGPVTLMGYSMGGAIGVTCAAAHPEMVQRLVLVAPSGIEIVENRFERFCRTVPLLGAWAHGAFAAGVMRGDRPMSKLIPREVASMQSLQLARRGYLPAVLASRQEIITCQQEAEHRKIAAVRLPVVAVWGTQDMTVPRVAIGTLAQWNRQVQHFEVAHAGHRLPYTHAAQLLVVLRQAFGTA